MSIEKPTESKLTPEDIVDIEKERVAHQVKSRVGGAEWVEDSDAENPRLRVADEQLEASRKEMEGDLVTRSLGKTVVSEIAPSSVLTEEEREALMHGLKSGGKKSSKLEKGRSGLKNKTEKEKAPKKKNGNKKIIENEDGGEESQRDAQEKEITKLERELSEKSKAGASKEELGVLEEERDRLKRKALKKKGEAEGEKTSEEEPKKEKTEQELTDEEKHKQLLELLKIDTLSAETKARKYGFTPESGITKTVGVGITNTLGSIFGYRFAWEAPKLIHDLLKKKGTKDAAHGLIEEMVKRNSSEKDQGKDSKSKTKEELGFWKKNFAKIGIKIGNHTEEKGIPSTEEKADIKDVKLLQNKMHLFDTYLDNTKLSEEQKVTLHNEFDASLREDTSPYIREHKLNLFSSKLEEAGLSKADRETMQKVLYEKPSPIQEKIADFNEKLRSLKRPAEEKIALRHELAKILWEHRHSSEKIDGERTESITEAFDTYANNSAQIMTVTKEAVNTASVITMMPWLRSIGYITTSAGESLLKANSEFNKKNFEKEPTAAERFGYVAKTVIVDSFNKTREGWGKFLKKESYTHGLKHFWKESGNTVFSSVMTGMQLAGVAEFEHALRSGHVAMEAGSQAFWQAVDNGHITEAIKQGGHNLVINQDRILSYVGLAENPDKAVVNIMGGGASSAAMHTAHTTAEYPVTPEIEKLATIHKGEGVLNSFQRQIAHNPNAFGFQGDIHNTIAVHHFAQKEAYKIALEKKIVDPSTCTELRVRFDPKHTTEFILHPDHSYTESFGGHNYMVEPGTLEHIRNHSTSGVPHTTEHAPNIRQVSTKPETQQVLDNAHKVKEQFKNLGSLQNTNNMHVKLDTGGNVLFWFNKKGEFDRITFTHILSPKESTDMWNYLKPNWQQVEQMSSIPHLNLPMANQEIRIGLGNIVIMDKALAQLRMAKHMNTDEYRYIEKSLEGTISNMQWRFGKIFNPLTLSGKDITR